MSACSREIGIEMRPMLELDFNPILEIERAVYLYPWSQGVFMDCLRAGYCCWVIEESRQIKGYGIMQVIADEAHVLNLCIHSQYQGLGFGRRLLRQLMHIAAGHYAQNMLLEVRPSNKAAISLYHSEGFTQIGRRSKYYPNHKSHSFRAGDKHREDALVLSCPLDNDYDTVFPQGLGMT